MKIDIFLTWCNGNDEKWQKKKASFATQLSGDAGIERYRNWDNLKYVFRGIEKNMPWINKVFFVTDGQIPEFLDLTNPKLEVINHTDYIPADYLPTFNSNTIEMNAFRIETMSENFILFNDDIFPIDYIPEDYFFRDNLVCDEAIERIIGTPPLNHAHCLLNNAWIINKYFDKIAVKKLFFKKWFYIGYGLKNIFRNVLFNYFHDFEALRNPHEPLGLKKSVMKNIWEKEPVMLDTGSRNKFRYMSDVTWYAVRYWQIFEGNFYPRLHKGKTYTVTEDNFKRISDEIRNRKYPLVCVDEKFGEPLQNFDDARDCINTALESVFPEKSSFER